MSRCFLGIVVLLVSLASSTLAADADRTDLALRIVDQHVLPGYQHLGSQTQRLRQATGAYCSVDKVELSVLRDAFASAFQAWAAIGIIDAGPIQAADRRFRFQFWPDPRGLTGKQIRDALGDGSRASALTRSISSGSVAVQGFPALERLIHPNDEAGLALIEKPETRPIACAMATAIAVNLDGISKRILREWRDPNGFRDAVVVAADGEGPLNSPTEALSALLTGPLAGLEGITRLQLARPLGPSADRPRPKRAEAWRSALSLDLVRARLESLEALYLLDGVGLDRALREAGFEDLADLLVRAFKLTRKTANGIDVSLAVAVSEPALRPRVEDLSTKVAALREILVIQAYPARGIPPRFNSLDGD